MDKVINQDLIKTNAFVWLKYEDNGKGEVIQMNCSICTQFQKQIQHNRDFSDARIKGTYSLHVLNAVDHSAMKCHQHACTNYT